MDHIDLSVLLEYTNELLAYLHVNEYPATVAMSLPFYLLEQCMLEFMRVAFDGVIGGESDYGAFGVLVLLHLFYLPVVIIDGLPAIVVFVQVECLPLNDQLVSLLLA